MTKIITHHYTSAGETERFEAMSKFKYELIVNIPNRETYSVYLNSKSKLNGILLGFRLSDISGEGVKHDSYKVKKNGEIIEGRIL